MSAKLLRCAVLLTLGLLPALASEKADPRVKTVLDKLDLNYSLDEQHDYRLEFTLESKRSQVVYIYSSTTKVEDIELRDVVTAAAEFKGPVPAAVLEKCMAASRKLAVGSWELEKDDETGNRVLLLVCKIPTDTSPAALRTILEASCIQADQLEGELSDGQDKF
ncbi:MAG: hypothetical protein IT204_00610 [Fimbriimonadaceae bacterium]|nr:hypothetical protein [Fimbriimonadaceae bacterium]